MSSIKNIQKMEEMKPEKTVKPRSKLATKPKANKKASPDKGVIGDMDQLSQLSQLLNNMTIRDEKSEEKVLNEVKEEPKTEPKTESKDDPYIETPWHIIESYFKGQHLERLVRHQLESYNHFINVQIMKTIEMFNPLHIKSEQDYDAKTGKYALELFITFENFHIYRPQIHENNGATKLMFPHEARLRNFTYA